MADTASHQHGDLFDSPPSEREVRVAGFTVYRIAEEKVREERGLVETLSLMAQLGALPGAVEAAQ